MCESAMDRETAGRVIPNGHFASGLDTHIYSIAGTWDLHIETGTCICSIAGTWDFNI